MVLCWVKVYENSLEYLCNSYKFNIISKIKSLNLKKKKKAVATAERASLGVKSLSHSMSQLAHMVHSAGQSEVHKWNSCLGEN